MQPKPTMKNHLTRRHFLAVTTTAALGIQFVPHRVFGANARIHIAGIGVGGKGRGEINDAAAEGCNIVALCDVDENRALPTFEKFPNAKRYTDFRLMLERQKDIDAVTVSTPDHLHAPAAILAMKLGKHVYCQKPLAHSIHEARRMAETARQCKVVTQMGNQAHANEPIRRAVEWVRAGVIGPVKEVHLWTNRPIWPQGLERPAETPPIPEGLEWDLWLGPAPARPYHPAYVPFKWRGWWDFGTGALGDMACHIMDMAYWSLALQHPISVEAESAGATRESGPLWSTITYQFPARGGQPPVKMVWYDGKKEGIAAEPGTKKKAAVSNLPPEEILEGQDAGKFDLVMIGEKGRMFFNRASTNWIITPKAILDSFPPPALSIPRTKNEDYEWLAAIRGDGPAPLSNFALSGPFTETVLLGSLAIRTGKHLLWDAENMRATNAPEAAPYIRRDYRKGWEV